MRLAEEVAAPDTADGGADDEFAVELDVFSGPFSVLLSLIARKRLDITEVALAEVTDEFIAFVHSRPELELSQVSEFLVVAATLLDMKAARLLPRDSDDEEDLELLEQRDLLFAKLLQYRAFKDIARDIAAALAEQALYAPRNVPMEETYAQAVPEVTMSITLADFAALAAAAFTREHSAPEVSVEHLHAPLVPVASQVEYIQARLTSGDKVTFTALCADAPDMPTVVSRFLAILELLRTGRIDIEQSEALGSLVIVRINASDEDSSQAPVEDAHVSSEEACAWGRGPQADEKAGQSTTIDARIGALQSAPIRKGRDGLRREQERSRGKADRKMRGRRRARER